MRLKQYPVVVLGVGTAQAFGQAGRGAVGAVAAVIIREVAVGVIQGRQLGEGEVGVAAAMHLVGKEGGAGNGTRNSRVNLGHWIPRGDRLAGDAVHQDLHAVDDLRDETARSHCAAGQEVVAEAAEDVVRAQAT